MGILDRLRAKKEPAGPARVGQTEELKATGDIAGLVRLLVDPDHDYWAGKAREEAARALAEMGDPAAIEALLDTIRDGDSPGWKAASRVASAVRDARVIGVLVRALSEADYSVRAWAETALRAIGTEAADVLVELVGQGDPRLRNRATVILATMGDRRAVEPLIELLADDSPVAPRTDEGEVRYSAAVLLGTLGDPRGIETLVRLLESSKLADSAAYGLVEMGQAATDALLAVLRRDDPALRLRVISILAKTDDRRAGEPLVGLLADPDPETRRQAARALGKLGDAGAVKPLLELLTDEDLDVRLAAASALGAIGDTGAVDGLSRALAPGDSRTRAAAAMALGEIGDRAAVDPLIAAREDPDSMVRRIALVELWGLGWSEGAVSALDAADALHQLFEFSNPRSWEHEDSFWEGRIARPVRIVGSKLNEQGGFDLMLEVHRLFEERRSRRDGQYLESLWNDIGSWQS